MLIESSFGELIHIDVDHILKKINLNSEYSQNSVVFNESRDIILVLKRKKKKSFSFEK